MLNYPGFQGADMFMLISMLVAALLFFSAS